VIGQRINNYEIVELIGEGGMGSVYMARHPFIDRKVAIKVLRASLANDPSVVQRFFNEARAASAIKHPNIIDILDVGLLPDNRTPYLTMELLEGESVSRRIKQRLLSPPEAVDIALQTAAAVGAAHAQGIVHRDLKPENLFLARDPRTGETAVKVLDFGIAKLRGPLSGDGVRTQTGALMGTPPYMSPEQCRGISSEVDHRTDIYALGIILYEMLCGAPPFVGEGFGDVLVQHLTRAPDPPRSRNPAVPKPLERIILRALAKTIAQRYPTMSDMQAALEGKAPEPEAAEEPLTTSEQMAVGKTTALPFQRQTTTLSANAGEIDEPDLPASGGRRLIFGGLGIAMAAAVALFFGLRPTAPVERPAAAVQPPVGAVKPPTPVEAVKPPTPVEAVKPRPPALRPDAGAAVVETSPAAPATPKKPVRKPSKPRPTDEGGMGKW
jgi:serine/threonine-protein kinase